MTPPSSASGKWCRDPRFWQSPSIARAWLRPSPRWFTSRLAWRRFERLKPQPRAVDLRRRRRTVRREPAIIELLPFVRLRFGAGPVQIDVASGLPANQFRFYIDPLRGIKVSSQTLAERLKCERQV